MSVARLPGKSRLISKLVSVLLPLLFVAAPIGALLLARIPGQENFVSRAVFANGRLWLLSDAGDLSSIVEGKGKRINESLPEPALDLCLRQTHPEVITCERNGCENWTLHEWIDG